MSDKTLEEALAEVLGRHHLLDAVVVTSLAAAVREWMAVEIKITPLMEEVLIDRSGGLSRPYGSVLSTAGVLREFKVEITADGDPAIEFHACRSKRPGDADAIYTVWNPGFEKLDARVKVLPDG